MADKKERAKTPDRGRIIVRTSVIGVAANVLLAAFKVAVGAASHSIAITMDAVNNLSDALSSVITIIGTRLAGRAPDKDHPLGHGRIEYLSAMIISVLVLYAGITAFTESVKAIIDPAVPRYSPVSLVIVAVAVLVKILLGTYVRRIGEKVNSGSLIASGEDARLDAAISASTLAAAGIYLIFGLRLEAWLGALIALVIVKAGIDMLRETLNDIIGHRADSGLTRDIKATICGFPDVSGAYDLVLHNYGPDTLVGSVHIEIPDTYTADRIDELTRRIQREVYMKHNVIMAAVGIYSVNTRNDFAAEARTRITKLVMSHDNVLQMHGFYLDEAAGTISFDIIIAFSEKDRHGLYRSIVSEVQELYPDYRLLVTMDDDVSD